MRIFLVGGDWNHGIFMTFHFQRGRYTTDPFLLVQVFGGHGYMLWQPW